MRSFIALDLATRTGWAMAALNPAGKLQIQSGVESFAPKAHIEGAGMRYLRFSRWLDEMHKMCPFERLAFEEVKQRPASVAAGHMYGGFMATLTAWCEANSVPYEGVGVGVIKKYIAEKGNASKDEVKAAIKARGHDPKDDNEADALALLYYLLSYATPSHPGVRPAPDRQPQGRVPVGAVPVARRRIKT